MVGEVARWRERPRSVLVSSLRIDLTFNRETSLSRFRPRMLKSMS